MTDKKFDEGLHTHAHMTSRRLEAAMFLTGQPQLFHRGGICRLAGRRSRLLVSKRSWFSLPWAIA